MKYMLSKTKNKKYVGLELARVDQSIISTSYY